jgi:hypothetical protein
MDQRSIAQFQAMKRLTRNPVPAEMLDVLEPEMMQYSAMAKYGPSLCFCKVEKL